MKKSTPKKNREFTAFFEENEHGGFTVTVPALPGLVTEVKDMHEARTVVADAVSCYIQGLKKAKADIPSEDFVASMRFTVTA